MGLMQDFTATTEHNEAYYDALHEDDYNMQDNMSDLIVFIGNKGDSDDTLYYYQAMSAPDKIKFQEAMLKEFNDHTDKQHWVPVLLTTLSFGTKVLDSIWAMKRKRYIITQAITKWNQD